MNWTQIWIDLFGTTEWLGLNMGFWVASGVVLVVVVIMNVVFWNMEPLPRDDYRARGPPGGRPPRCL